MIPKAAAPTNCNGAVFAALLVLSACATPGRLAKVPGSWPSSRAGTHALSQAEPEPGGPWSDVAKLETGTPIVVGFRGKVRYKARGDMVVDRLRERLEGRFVDATEGAVRLTTRHREREIQVEGDRGDVQQLAAVQEIEDPSWDGALVGAGLGAGFFGLVGGFGESARDDAGLTGIMVSTSIIAGAFAVVGYLGDRRTRGTEERVIYRRAPSSADEGEEGP